MNQRLRSTEDGAAHELVKNRHAYRRPEFQETMDKMEAIRQMTADCADNMIALCPPSDERDKALDSMNDACMQAIASLARHEEHPRYSTAPNTTSHVPGSVPRLPAEVVKPYPATPDAEQKS